LVSGVAGLSTGEEKEEEIKKKPHQLQNLMSASAMQGGHKNRTSPKTNDSGKNNPKRSSWMYLDFLTRMVATLGGILRDVATGYSGIYTLPKSVPENYFVH